MVQISKRQPAPGKPAQSTASANEPFFKKERKKGLFYLISLLAEENGLCYRCDVVT